MPSISWSRWDSERVEYFFKKMSTFNFFNELEHEKLHELSSIASSFNKECRNKSTYSKQYKFFEDYKCYGFLNNYKYDEALALLILIFDSDCKILLTFLELLYQLSKEPLSELISEYKLSKYKYQCFSIPMLKKLYNVSNELFGFYDDNLIDIEWYFFNKFIINQPLDVSFDSKFYLDIMVCSSVDFKSVSGYELNDMKDKINYWVSCYSVQNYWYLLAFQMQSNPRFFNNPDDTRKIIYLILAIDPHLELLQIYDTSCNWKNIETEAIERIGFYDKNLIFFEKEFNKYFPVVDECFYELNLEANS